MSRPPAPWEKYQSAAPKRGPWEKFAPSEPEGEKPTAMPASMGGSVGFKPGMAAPFEAALQVVSGAIAQPVSGLVGLMSTVIPGAPPSGQVVRDVQEAMTYQPRTPEGQGMLPAAAEGIASLIPDAVKNQYGNMTEAYGRFADAAADKYGPAAGAAVVALPTAAIEAVPGAVAVRRLRAANTPAPAMYPPTPSPGNAPQGTQSVPPNPSASQNPLASGAAPMEPPSARQYQQVASELRSGKTERVAPTVGPDMQILKDAEALGIDLNPSHYSTNRAYIDLEQSLKSRPGSLLQTKEEKAILELGNKADDLIDSIGGITDKSELDEVLRGEFSSTMSGLEAQSNALYTKVDNAIPRATRVIPQATIDFIKGQIDELGGDESLLTSAEKSLLRFIKEDADGNVVTPTYAAVDRVRRDIGSAIGARSGPFKDDDTGQLRRLYAVLAEDQQKFAEAFGVGNEYRDASDLVKQRKRLEDQAITLYGRDVQGSIIPKLRQSAAGLTQGDISSLNKMMDAVPESRRTEVAASLLNDLFSSGARRNAPIGQGFVNAYAGLNRNPGAKSALFSYLPPEAQQRFDMLGRVATGIYRAKALENTSRSARDVIAAMDEGGLLGKLYGISKKVAAAEGLSSAVGMPGAGTAGVVGSVLTKGATPATKAADELLAAPAFKDAVIAYAAGIPSPVLQVTPQYQAWLKLQNPSVRAEIAAIGLIPWLTTNRETETVKPPLKAQSQG